MDGRIAEWRDPEQGAVLDIDGRLALDIDSSHGRQGRNGLLQDGEATFDHEPASQHRQGPSEPGLVGS